jgi:hypothetical protein
MHTETAPARGTACRGRLCRNSRLAGALGAMAKPRFLHSGNESGGLFAAISLRLVGRALRLRLRGITDSLSQHLAKLGLGLRRFPRIGLCPCGHKQYVGMPEVELNPAGSAKASRSCPLWCAQRTYLGHRGMSETCQQETHAPQQISTSIRSHQTVSSMALTPNLPRTWRGER